MIDFKNMKGWNRLFIFCSVLWVIYKLYEYPTVHYISDSAVETEIKPLLEKEAYTKFNKKIDLIVKFQIEDFYKKKANICAYKTKRGILEINPTSSFSSPMTNELEVDEKLVTAKEKTIDGVGVCIFNDSQISAAYETAVNNVLETMANERRNEYIIFTFLQILLAYLLFKSSFWVLRGFIYKD